MEHVDIGEIEIPLEYINFTKEEKDVICDKMIDIVLLHLDKMLPPEINRITILEQVLQSTLESNEKEELYEVCQVISDIQKRLNEA